MPFSWRSGRRPIGLLALAALMTIAATPGLLRPVGTALANNDPHRTFLPSGSFDNRPAATTNVLNLHVAPVHLDLLGAIVNTSPIDVSITSGKACASRRHSTPSNHWGFRACPVHTH